MSQYHILILSLNKLGLYNDKENKIVFIKTIHAYLPANKRLFVSLMWLTFCRYLYGASKGVIGLPL